MTPVNTLSARDQAMARAVAARWAKKIPASVDVQDLEQEALLGIWTARQTMQVKDPGQQDRYLRTQAAHAIADALRNSDPLSRTQRARVRALRKAVQTTLHETGVQPTQSMLCTALGCDFQQLRQDQALAAYQHVAWDAQTHDTAADDTSHDLLPDAHEVDPAVVLELQQTHAALDAALDALPTAEHAVLVLWVERRWPLERIGAWLGTSASRAHQIIRQAISRIQHVLAQRGLLDGRLAPAPILMA